MKLRVLALYPEQMNIYADRGNIIFLRHRCEWRGIGFDYEAAGPGEPVDPAAHDLFYVGGGQDRDQRIVAADMVATPLIQKCAWATSYLSSRQRLVSSRPNSGMYGRSASLGTLIAGPASTCTTR